MSFFRSESKTDDDRRTNRLLDSLDAAHEARTGGVSNELTDFEETVLHGVGYHPATQYPPAGHGYPKRG